MAEQRDGAWTWTHSDHLHSATIITDAQGAEIRRLAYAAFGEQAENVGTGDAPTYTYTGKEADASGLLYYGARYYDPVLARFITADTVDDVGPQGLNRYSYALNNPILFNDPTGHFINGPGGNINGSRVKKESADPNGERCLTGNPDDGGGTMVFHENDDDPNSIHYGAPYQNSNGAHRTYTLGQMDFIHPNIPNLTVGDILGAYLTAASMTPDDMLMEYVQSAADQRGSRALSIAVLIGGMVFSVDDLASPQFWKKAKNGADELVTIVRRFDTKQNIKRVRKNGIKFDASKGAGISATTTEIIPVNPNNIRDITGMSREPEAFVDINITGKKVIQKHTKSHHIEYQIQEDIKPSDIVDYGKVKKR